MINREVEKILIGGLAALGAVFVCVSTVARAKKQSSIYANEPEEKNPMEGKQIKFIENENDPENADGVKGHLQAIGDSDVKNRPYHIVKRGLDIILSFGGLVALAPVYAAVALAIKIDDPGPVLFTQKRVGKNKQFFRLHKFRSMKMSTPQNVPTHMLDNPDQYITKVGRVIRKYSIDELPQIWDIFLGNMSVIGPRPALWNQDKLVSLREESGANDIKPGLTGWAQICGRDELTLEMKAKRDCEYIEKESFIFDLKCFIGTIKKVIRKDGISEGAPAGAKNFDKAYTEGATNEELIGEIGFGEPVVVNRNTKKNVLITGAGSYIGESFKKYAKEHCPNLFIGTLNMLDESWSNFDFSKFDIVYHVAGIAHADVVNVSDERKEQYYRVNTDLAIAVAQKAKESGVGRFVFMSSMIVYGAPAPFWRKKVINRDVVPKPTNFYGDSKLQADYAIRQLASDSFKVIVLRPPMIYGKGSKGNYHTLSSIAKKVPVFPKVRNERSMLYIGNLCELLSSIMQIERITHNAVVLLPQNEEWVSTNTLVGEIAACHHKLCIQISVLKLAIMFLKWIPGRIGNLTNKAFGNFCYKLEDSIYDGLNYQIVKFNDSVLYAEGCKKDKRALIVASVASMIDQFNRNNINILKELGYIVDVACNFEEGNTCSDKTIVKLKHDLTRMGVKYYQVDFKRGTADILNNIGALNEMERILGQNYYDIVHCHSPIGGLITRIVAKKYRKRGTKVIYTAHGFHFFKGAPKKNWILYFPIEKVCSYWTDVLITINKEDYELAKNRMHAKKIKYVPGIGVDVAKFANISVDCLKKRSELNIPEKAYLLLSVGELNDNKNHIEVIEALKIINNPTIHYAIAGQGPLMEKLKKYEDNNVHLLGFREDVAELYKIADMYVLPSKREGLNVSLIEAKAAGCKVWAKEIRGNVDIIHEDNIWIFDKSNINNLMKDIYLNHST